MTGARPLRPVGRARAVALDHSALVLAIAFALAAAPVVPGFLTGQNAGNVASNLLPLLALAIGQTFVLIGGGIDLSALATVGLASVVGASIMTADGGLLAGSPLAVPAAVAAMVALGVGVGLVNGTSVAGLGMPPFLATLAAMMVVGGLSVWYANAYAGSEALGDLPPSFLGISREVVPGVAPAAIGLVAGLAAASSIALRRTLFGRWLFAIGQNRRAAVVSGVPVGRVVVASYAASGACAAVASILYTSRLETGLASWSGRILLDAIAAAVIGGTSLLGGRGRVAWTASGALFIALVDDSLSLANLSNFQVLMVKGSVILLAALLDVARARRALRT